MQFSEEVKLTLWNLIDEMSVDLSQFTAAYNNKPSLFNGYRILACDGGTHNFI